MNPNTNRHAQCLDRELVRGFFKEVHSEGSLRARKIGVFELLAASKRQGGANNEDYTKN